MTIDRVLAVTAKDLRQWLRDRQAMFGPLAVPLVLMFVATVLFGFGGDQWNIGLVDKSQGPHSTAFAQEVRDLRSNISPYFNVVTTDPDQAQRLVEEGRLQLVVTIPDDFDQTIAAGGTPELHTQVFNINTDMMKNARLRLDRAILDYTTATRPDLAPVTVAQVTTRPDDIWRRSFIGLSGIILAVMVGAALNSAIIIAREWERNTAKEVRLAPQPHTAVFTGKLLAGLIAGLANGAVAAVVGVGLFGVRIPWDRIPLLLLIGGLAALTCAGIGIAVGAWLRDYRAIQPLLLVTFAGSFFAAGGFSSIATLPPHVRAFDTWWPPAHVFDGMQAVALMAQPPSMTNLIIGEVIAAALAIGLGAAVVRARL